MLHGYNEAYNKDHFIYDNKWDKPAISFWGHLMDRENYGAHGFRKTDLWNFTRDLHHADGFVSKYVNGGIYLSIGLSKIKRPWKEVILDALINSALNTAATSITFATVSHSRLFYF